MASQKDLNCPWCKKSMPFGSGFEHDEELNFICSHCKKVIFGVTEEAENVLKKHVAACPHSSSSVMGFTCGTYFSRKEPLPIRLTNIEEEKKSSCCESKTTTDPSDEEWTMFV